jgi:hypothetical protein
MKVKELLDSPAKWTQRSFARDFHGNPTSSGDPTAVCWCLSGAINKCYDNSHKENDEVYQKLSDHLTKKYEKTIVGFNDSCTWPQLQQVLKDLDI